MFERLAIKDIQDAADVLRPVYERTPGARRLRQPRGLAVPGATTREAHDRRGAPAVEGGRPPNVMIKVPATPGASRRSSSCIGEGINVNVTLLFARDAYEAVAEAYIDGLESSRSAAASRSTTSRASPASS